MPISTLHEVLDNVIADPVVVEACGHVQAIRIEVNDELRILGPAIDGALDALVPGGRGMVITYHSGEDKITKDERKRMGWD